MWDVRAGLSDAAVDASPLPIVVIDDDHVLRIVNPAAARLVRRPAGELLGRSIAVLFPPEEADRAVARIDRAVADDLGHLEFDLLASGSRTIPVGMSFAPLIHGGRRVGIVGVGRDISGRRALRHEADQLAASFRALAESSVVGMYRFSFHPELRVDHVNPAFADSLGYSADSLMDDASPFWTNIPTGDAERFIANRRSATPSWPLEFEWSRPDGRRRVLSVTEVPLHGADGRLQAVLGIARDVTAEGRARVAMSESLRLEREATERLRRVDELRRLFLQAVSHELRTPLTVIAGFAATLQDHVTDLESDQIIQLSSRLQFQAAKMKALLDDLLDIERMSRGVITLELEPLDVAEVVRATVADEAGSGVRFAGSSATANIDRIKVERIVANLLSNARRHAGEGSVVSVEVATVGDRVRLTVDDDGPGIAEDHRQRVFEAFEQGPTASGAASPGTGIGLSLVREFTRLHHGTVTIERSRLGGARFVVELPLTPPVAPLPQAPSVDGTESNPDVAASLAVASDVIDYDVPSDASASTTTGNHVPTRTSSAEWQGDLKAGSGELSLGSGAFSSAYTFVSRFESGEGGTNPEELIGAAHAACYSMALSNMLAQDGTPATSVRTEAAVTLDTVDGAPTITKIVLTTVGEVPGIDEETFLAKASAAKSGCPVSKLVTGAEIELDATLSS